MRRYFIVFYTGYSKTKGNCNGNSCIFTNDGFLNQKILIQDLKKASELSELVITNIIELNELDFKEYTR